MQDPTLFDPADLQPDLGEHAQDVQRYAYWIGTLASAPIEMVTLAGINFPKVNERVVKARLDPTQTQRIPLIGTVAWIDEARIRLMRERLKRTVVRVLHQAEQKEEPGTGKNIGDPVVSQSRAQLITIPTAAEIAQRQKAGKATRAYTRHPGDVPAAQFLFAQVCPDQRNPQTGTEYPEPLSVTGLVWPHPMTDAPDFLS